MIRPKPRGGLRSLFLELWRRLTMPAAEHEQLRVNLIYEEMGGVLSKDEIRRIVRTHRF